MPKRPPPPEQNKQQNEPPQKRQRTAAAAAAAPEAEVRTESRKHKREIGNNTEQAAPEATVTLRSVEQRARETANHTEQTETTRQTNRQRVNPQTGRPLLNAYLLAPQHATHNRDQAGRAGATFQDLQRLFATIPQAPSGTQDDNPNDNYGWLDRLANAVRTAFQPLPPRL